MAFTYLLFYLLYIKKEKIKFIYNQIVTIMYKTEGNNDNRQIRDPKLLLDEQLVIKKKFLSIIPQ